MSMRAKPRSGASAPKGRGKPRRQRKKGSGPDYGSAGVRNQPHFQQSSIPASVGVVVRNPTFTRFGRAPFSDQAGDFGLRLEFCVPISTVLGILTGNGAMGGTSTSGSAASFMPVAPTVPVGVATPGFPAPWINIPQALVRFRFRKLILRYVTEASTTTTGTFVLAYISDGDGQVTNGGTAVANRELARSIEFPVWASQVELEAINDRDQDSKVSQLFYCQQGSAAVDANLRIANQGVLFLSPTLNYATSAQLGTLYACGTVDLYVQASNTQVGASPSETGPERAKRLALEQLPLAQPTVVFAMQSADKDCPRGVRAYQAETQVPPLRSDLDEDYVLAPAREISEKKSAERTSAAPALAPLSTRR